MLDYQEKMDEVNNRNLARLRDGRNIGLDPSALPFPVSNAGISDIVVRVELSARILALELTQSVHACPLPGIPFQPSVDT